MEIADPPIRLSKITEIMGRHFVNALGSGGTNPERVLRLFTDRVVEDLKKETENPVKK